MRIFTDTVCKQHEYQNMAPKNNPRGVSTLQKQELLQTRPQGQAQPRTQGITFAQLTHRSHNHGTGWDLLNKEN